MAIDYIFPLSDLRATLETVGGKGASLARLAQAGLSVPGGFHVTTAAYRQFVVENNLQPAILVALASADAAQPATLEAASGAIQAQFLRAPMPPAIAQAIACAYSGLGETPAVAVRSSATAEDLPELSFAGQQDTYLNIRGADAVLDAVKRCWASLWTARAIGYRLQHHIDQNAVSLAVVVQSLVCAQSAGVLFTANPLTGQRSEAMLTAAWGLGEAVVGGRVTPDTFTLDKATGRVLKRDIGDKQVMTVRVNGGTQEQPVPEAQRRLPALTDLQAAELAGQGVKIEQLYQRPMDIEWALAEGRLAILQARPITALPEPELPLPAEWPLPDPKPAYFRGSITEQLPDPLTPLFATLGRRIISAGSARLFNTLCGPGTADDDMFLTINGYAYYKMRLSLRFAWGMLTGVVAFWPELVRCEQRWRDAHAHYVGVIDQWRSRPASALASGELLEGARQLMTETVNVYNVLQSGALGLAGAAETLFAGVYGRLAKRRGDPPAATFLLGFDSLPILADKSLYDLAQQARACSALAEHLLRTSTAQLVNELATEQSPADLPADDWRAWQHAFSGHLERYGHAVYDLDFAKPVPADDPAPLLDTCRLCLSGRGTNPHERQQALADRREQITQALFSRLGGLRLKVVRKTLGWARTFAPLREDGLADLGLGYPLLRRLLRELGRRLNQAGMISEPDDVYWLSEDEAGQAAAALDRGEALSSFADEIRQRKALWRSQKRLTPPTALPLRSRMSRAVEGVSASRTSQAAGNVIKGTGSSQGCVTGKARVLHGPEDFGTMQPGEVLVAAITTPAWTPLFAMASAIVTDVGGALSHGSIVAREYGIPAVLGTGVATKRIQSGQVITVDGTAGTVTLLAESADARPGSGHDDAPPTEWKLPKGQYAAVRNNIVELMPEPLTPLFGTWGRAIINGSLGRLLTLFVRQPDLMSSDLIITVNGYAYNNGSVRLGKLLLLLFDSIGILRRMFTGAVERWTQTGRPRYVSVVEHWQGAPWHDLSGTALLASAHDVFEAAIEAYGALISGVIPAAWITEGLFTSIYNALLKRRGDPAAATYLLGFDSAPIRAEQALFDLAEWARSRTSLAGYLLATPSQSLAAQLHQEQAPHGIEADEWHEWQQRFQAHLRQHGHTFYNLDFANSVPADDPAPLLETCKLFLRGQGTNPYSRQQSAVQQREQAAQALEQRLKGWRLNLFRKFYPPARRFAPLREDGLAEVGLGYPLLRQMLRELGRRFVEAGLLEHPDDIFWLEQGEVEQAAARLDDHQVLESAAALVSQRQARWQAARKVAPPLMLPQMKVAGVDLMEIRTGRSRKMAAKMIRGVAASSGRATAPARVLRGPEDFGQMQPGEVLVAAITTPAWTPLFAMAAAIVTDVGGPLSHGSIVAREYGIPAVLGTGVATQRIRSGQVITVDGTAGTVAFTAEK